MAFSLNWGRFYSRYWLSLRYGLRLNKPILIVRLAYNYLRLLTGLGPLIRSVDFAPTYKCNLKCEHCFASDLEDESRPKMTLNDYGRVAKEARKLGAIHFAFQGGEPTILPELEDLIKAISPSRSLVSITTNATTLDVGRIKKIKKLGVDILTVSLDSSLPKEHDSFRGAIGTHQKAIDTIDNALAQGLSVCINTMVSHQNINESGFRGLVDYTRKKGIKINVLLPAPVGRWVGNFSSMLDIEDQKTLKALMEKNPHIRRDLDANYLHYGCGAMKESIYISCYGDVLPCPYIHASIGNVLEEPLRSIWERGLKLDVFKKYHPVCLAEEDMRFIDEHLTPIEKYGSKPAPIGFLEEGESKAK
ncbi:MAG: radical SAM protein [Candidatus Altiarchaeota archaeon]